MANSNTNSQLRIYLRTIVIHFQVHAKNTSKVEIQF